MCEGRSNFEEPWCQQENLEGDEVWGRSVLAVSTVLTLELISGADGYWLIVLLKIRSGYLTLLRCQYRHRTKAKCLLSKKNKIKKQKRVKLYFLYFMCLFFFF